MRYLVNADPEKLRTFVVGYAHFSHAPWNDIPAIANTRPQLELRRLDPDTIKLSYNEYLLGRVQIFN